MYNRYICKESLESTKNFEEGGSLFIDGYLPDGTAIDFYFCQAFGGELKFIEDDEEIYSKKNEPHEYKRSKLNFKYLIYACNNIKQMIVHNFSN